MRLKFNQNSELFFPDFGLYKPKQVVDIEDESAAKKMLATKYFDEIKDRKKKNKKKRRKINI